MKRRLFYAREITVIFLLVIVTCLDLETLSRRFFLPRKVRTAAVALGLSTPWTMFTGPQNWRGWMVIAATLEDGRQMDLLTGETVVWTRPALPVRKYRNMRWAKFYFSSLNEHYKKLHENLARFYGEKWNREHPNNKARYVQVLCMWQPMLPMYNMTPPKPWLAGSVKLVTE